MDLYLYLILVFSSKTETVEKPTDCPAKTIASTSASDLWSTFLILPPKSLQEVQQTSQRTVYLLSLWDIDLHEGRMLSFKHDPRSRVSLRSMWSRNCSLSCSQFICSHSNSREEGMCLGISLLGLSWRRRPRLEERKAIVSVETKVLVFRTAMAYSFFRPHKQEVGLA